jgi:hypothetical protein
MRENAVNQGYDPTVGGRLIEITRDNLVQLGNGNLGVHDGKGVIYGYGSDASSAYGGTNFNYKPMSTSIMKEGTTLSGQQVTNSGLSPWGASTPGDAFNQSLQGSWQVDPWGGYQRINDAEAMKNAFYNVNVNDQNLPMKTWEQMMAEYARADADPYTQVRQQNVGNAILTRSQSQADNAGIASTTVNDFAFSPTYNANTPDGYTPEQTKQAIDSNNASNQMFASTKSRKMLNDGSMTNGIGIAGGAQPQQGQNALAVNTQSNDYRAQYLRNRYMGQGVV